jgi:hypothetical protein
MNNLRLGIGRGSVPYASKVMMLTDAHHQHSLLSALLAFIAAMYVRAAIGWVFLERWRTSIRGNSGWLSSVIVMCCI